MEVKLIVANGKQKGKEIPVATPKFLIGRGEGCQLRPQNNLVSRKHCMILTEGCSPAIEDLGSTNGTFVNDERIHGRRELKDGDTIKVGVLDVAVKLIGAAESKTPSKTHGAPTAIKAADSAAAAAAGDDFDVSRWLGDDDAVKLNPPRKEPLRTDDTMAGKSMIDTATIPVPIEPNKEEKKPASAKTAGKLPHPPAKPTTDSSGEAADDALRHFFQRKKT